MTLRPFIFASLVALSGVAAAEPSPSPEAAAAPESPYAMGLRIGGYGFRHETDAATTDWNECRMNGLGLFAQRGLRGPLFLEAGLDTYFSIGQGAPTDLPLDRQSALVSVAAGVRTNITPWLRGYIQLGAGVELTRLAVPYGDGTTIRDDKVMPDGFFGAGGEIRIMRGTYIGATLRTHVMGNFNYDPTRLQMSNQWVAAPQSSDVFKASPAFAEQGQFYVRKDL
jgi:hypothetical protein